MTIKQFIDKYFEYHVGFDDDVMLFVEEDFWQAWEKLRTDMENHGPQWAFEWYEDEPELSATRVKLIEKAVDNYITNKHMPRYTNR